MFVCLFVCKDLSHMELRHGDLTPLLTHFLGSRAASLLLISPCFPLYALCLTEFSSFGLASDVGDLRQRVRVYIPARSPPGFATY